MKKLLAVLALILLVVFYGLPMVWDSIQEQNRISEAVQLQKRTAPNGETRMVKTADGIEYAFRWCPPGEFMMGSPEEEPGHYDSETQHLVKITRGFWLLETEVTQAMWESVMGQTVSQQRDNPDWELCGEGANYPMYYVSWDETQEFCMKLSQILGYRVQLPTEAQWEYACRAGSTGAHAGNLHGMAWYNEDDRYGSAHPVRLKKPNAWGLYDMHGNVWELCSDYFDINYYAKSPTSDPENTTPSDWRADRGGGWWNNAELCRSARRSFMWPDVKGTGGFRILLVPSPAE